MPGVVQLFQVVRAAVFSESVVPQDDQSLGSHGFAQGMSSVPTVALSPPLASVIISDQRDRKVLVLNTGFLFKVPVLLIHTLFSLGGFTFPVTGDVWDKSNHSMTTWVIKLG